MPTTARSENNIIRLFVSAYDNGSWKDAALTFPDEAVDGGIDGLAIRTDGAQLAIEHTVVEPFAGDIADQTEMIPMLLQIENDASLVVPNVWIRVFVPVGLFHLQKPPARKTLVGGIHDWLRANRLKLPMGDSEQACVIPGASGRSDMEITLTLKVVALSAEGKIHVRRQQIGDTLAAVVERMLAKKLPKLVKTPATKRILLLERQHMNHDPLRILRAIEDCRSQFPAISDVTEIWIVETMFYGTAFGGFSLRFELYENEAVTKSYDFNGENLVMRFEDDVEECIRPEEA